MNREDSRSLPEQRRSSAGFCLPITPYLDDFDVEVCLRTYPARCGRLRCGNMAPSVAGGHSWADVGYEAAAVRSGVAAAGERVT
jgi:hypothetical protein